MKNATRTKLTILYANQSMGMGGAEQFMTDLLTTLADDSNISIRVASTHGQFLETFFSPINTIPIRTVIDLIGNWKGLLKAVFLFPKAVIEWARVILQIRKVAGKKVILMSGFNEKLIVTPIARMVGIPVVWIEFSSLQTVLSDWFGLIGTWYRSYLPLVETIITSSEFSKEALLKELTLSVDNITVIPCGRSLATQKKNKLKPLFDFPYILSVSRLQPGKGQDMLIDAFSLLHQDFPDLKLVLVGEGDFLETLQHKVEALQLQDSVIFTGRVDDVQTYYQHAKVFVFPSMWELEGFGLVLIEAMAYQAPIVTFDRGPLNEIIQDQKNGLLAEQGLAQDLAKKIAVLLKSPRLAKQYVTQAAKDFQTKYTSQQSAQMYKAQLQAVTNSRKR